MVKSCGLTLGLHTVFLYLPQPVAACMIVLPPGGSLPALAQVTLPVHPPHPFTYLAASWKVDVEHTPAPDFTRWSMSRVTCGTFLRGLSTLQSVLQPSSAPSDPTNAPLLPSCNAGGRQPGQHAVPRRPDRAFFESELVSTTSIANAQKRSQPQVQEIPLALRQSHAIVLPVASPLLQVVRSLHFYFLLARTPLSDVEVGHLTSPNRLVFGSASIPKLPTKRPQQQPPTSLAALVSCLQRCRPMAPAMAASGPQAPATSGT